MSDSDNGGQKLKYLKGAAKETARQVKQIDWVAVSAGGIVLISAILMYNHTTHTIPQTSTTFMVLPVVDLSKLLDLTSDNVFESLASYEASSYHTASNLHAVGALKYTLSCYC